MTDTGNHHVCLLDGAMGTELGAMGFDLGRPSWSAEANRDHPDWVRAVHGAYARAGADVHTTNTFRTRPRTVGDAWRDLTTTAVGLTRAAARPGQRVAGSIAPLEDCYRPDLSPTATYAEHHAFAVHLGRAGVDLVLVETFPDPREALEATEAAVAARLETWLALTPGPDGALMTPTVLVATARRAVASGAAAVLVNCLDATRVPRWLDPLVDAGLGVPIGAYANAGPADAGLGWGRPDAADRYADLAVGWIERGASVVGGCCGTGPAHIAAIAARLGR